MDVRLSEVRARLAAIPKKLAEVEARVTAARTELATSKAAHTTALTERKKFELDVEQWKEKGRKYRDQAYQVKTNDAFKTLQHEATNADQEAANAEDRLLEQMVAGEEYDRRIKASEKVLKEVEETAKGERAKIEVEQRGGRERIASRWKRNARRPSPRCRKICSITIIASRANMAERRWRKFAMRSAGPAACACARMCFRKCGARGTSRSIIARPARGFFITSSLRRRLRLLRILWLPSRPINPLKDVKVFGTRSSLLKDLSCR